MINPISNTEERCIHQIDGQWDVYFDNPYTGQWCYDGGSYVRGAVWVIDMSCYQGKENPWLCKWLKKKRKLRLSGE